MNLLIELLRGRAMTGATGVRNSSGKTDVASSIDNIKLSSKKQKFAKKEIIAKDKGEVWDEKVIGLRICTDGKPTKMFKDNKKYGDKSHKDTTACFTVDKSDVSDISADKIPYIVVPKTEKGIEYKYSVGVIVNLKGDYLYCVVAEVGPVDKGLGEVSIYAAWKMKGWKVPPDVKKEGKINEKYCIGEKTQYQYKGSKKHRHKVPWRIILFKTSAPYKKGEINWQCNDTEKLKEQIILEGKKCYTGTGECLN